MPDDELALLDRWCAGDAGAGNALFKRHFETVYRFFERKVEGELDELVQETFLACLRSRDTFRRQSSFRTYLLAIARHTLFGYWRRRSRQAATLDFDESPADCGASRRRAQAPPRCAAAHRAGDRRRARERQDGDGGVRQVHNTGRPPRSCSRPSKRSR